MTEKSTSLISIDLIIFDLDGTLVNSGQDIVNAVNFTLKNLGLKERAYEDVLSYVGTGVKDLIRKSIGADNEGMLNKAISVFEEYYKDHIADACSLYPGVSETLEYFKDKTKVIITNRKYKFAKALLDKFKIAGYFKDLLGGDNIGCMKPSSCPLDKIMTGFDIRDKSKAIIIGDMDIDIIAGKNAGILTCAVTYGIGKRQDILNAKPDFIIDNLSQLKQMIT